MASLWQWEPGTHRYRDTSTGRFLGRDAMLGLRDQFIERQKEQTTEIATRLTEGRTDINGWLTDMREAVKDSFVNEYILAHGGRNTMTPADWGRVGAMVKEQYGYLQHFAEDVQQGMSEAQIANRSKMYIDAATQAFERGKAETMGLPRLPQYPADGNTQCLCIVSPESRVLTRNGLVAISEVKPGAMVLTHRGRWRRVLHSVVKESQPYHQLARIITPDGNYVDCTTNHRWYTPDGWASLDSIDNSMFMMYHLQKDLLLEVEDGKLHEMWQVYPVRQFAKAMQCMCGDMPNVWGTKRSSCRRVSFLCEPTNGQSTVARDAPKDDEGNYPRKQQATDSLRRPVVGYNMAAEIRWPTLDMVLDRQREASDDLPVSVGMGAGAWPDPGRLYCSSQGWRPNQRRDRELRPFEAGHTHQASWQECTSITAESCMRDMRESVSQETEKGSAISVLFAGMLSAGTKIYDLCIEEDHSFVVEGLIAHNSNCKCGLEYVQTEDGWEITWTINPTVENCDDCLALAARWNPLVVTADGQMTEGGR